MKRKLIYLLGIVPVLLLNGKIIYAKEPTIGKTLPYPLTFKNYQPLKFEEATYTEIYGSESIKVKETQGWIWGSESKDYPTKGIAIYRIGTIEAPYVHNVIGYLPKGSTYEYSTKRTKVYNFSSEVSLSTEHIYKAALSAEGNIYAIKAIGEFDKEVQIKIGTNIITSYTSETEDGIKVTIPIEDSGYYFDDLRATYKLYQIQEYQIINTRKETDRKQSGWAVDVYYDVIQTCVCTNISYVCEYVSDCGRCIVKYKQNSGGTFSYDGPKSCEGIIYI